MAKRKKSSGLFRPSQEIFFKSFINDDAEIFWLARRRLGKTRAALVTLMISQYYFAGLIDLEKIYPCKKLKALRDRWREGREGDSAMRNSSFIFVLPQDSQATRVLRPEMEICISLLNAKFPRLPKWKFRKSDKKMFFKHEGREYPIYWTGIDRVSESLRGLGADLVAIDEIADIDPVQIKTILVPLLLDSGGYKFLVGTAKASANINSLKQEYKSSKSKKYIETTIEDSIKRGEFTRKELNKLVRDEYGGDFENPILQQEFYMRSDLPIENAVMERFDFKPVALFS
ncbi:MAG: hypothetical protein ACR2N8_03015 [Parvibaculales bacterium]